MCLLLALDRIELLLLLLLFFKLSYWFYKNGELNDLVINEIDIREFTAYLEPFNFKN